MTDTTSAQTATWNLERRLPEAGLIRVERGERVEAQTVIAQTDLPGKRCLVNAADDLGVPPEDLPRCLQCAVGDTVAADQVLARTRGFLGLSPATLRAPCDGVVEDIWTTTGQILLRGTPGVFQLRAFAPGVVADVHDERVVTIATDAVWYRGAFGWGGEAIGQLTLLVDAPDAPADAGRLTPDLRDRIVVVGLGLGERLIRAARAVGVSAIIAASADAIEFVGADDSCADWNRSHIDAAGPAVVITENFGRTPMRTVLFEAFRRSVNRVVSIDGTTHIRAGARRPRILLSRDCCDGGSAPAGCTADETGKVRPASVTEVFGVGDGVRALVGAYAGRFGRCVALPDEQRRIDTEALVRVAVVDFGEGTVVALPRTNVERV